VATTDARPPQTAKTLCLLADWFDEHYQETIRQTAEDAVHQRGANLLSFAGGIPGSSIRDSHKRHAVFDLVSRSNVDGAILLAGTMVNELGPSALEGLLDKLRGIPLCSIGVELKDVPSIVIDNQAGIDRALTHLVEHHGCKRIAFIRGPAKNKEAESRFAAYQEGLARLDLKKDAALVFQGDFLSASGEAAVAHWLKTRTLPDAIIAANDEMALGALSALTNAGINVPTDVKLVGFDDLENSRLSTPPITTVRQPIKDLAIAAVRTIMDQLLGRDVPQLQILQTQLVLRESCGCTLRLSASGQSQFPEPTVDEHVSFTEAFANRAQSLRAEMARVARGEFHSLGPWEDELIRAFQDTMQGESSRFTEELTRRIAQVANLGGEVARWHDIVTAFRRVAIPSTSSDPALRQRCEEVLHEARLITAQAVERAEARKRLTASRSNRALQQASFSIASAFNPHALDVALHQNLPKLGISEWYVTAYTPSVSVGTSLPQQGQLVSASVEVSHSTPPRSSDGEQPTPSTPSYPAFPLTTLAAREVWPPQRLYRLTCVPLYLHEQQLGFAMLNSHGVEAGVVEALRASLSIALYGGALYGGTLS
jgi:sigma-B regulation protein RsbU (phosphoserine phosphatase)